MIKTLSKNKSLSIILTLLIGIEIFFFSSLPGTNQSGGITFIPIIYHFAVFFLFNFFLFYSLQTKQKFSYKVLIVTIFFSLIYAISDEIHQSFVPMRSSTITDILTDFIGIIFSSAIILKIKNKINKPAELSPPSSSAKYENARVQPPAPHSQNYCSQY